MWNDYYSAATAPGRGRAPLPRDYPLYALLDAQSAVPEREAEAFQAMLEEALEREWVLDASIAQSHRDAQDFWSLRDAIAEMLSDYAPTINFDVSVPVTHIGVCVDRMRAELAAAYPGLRCLFFGHVGDSNIHLVAGPHDELDPDGRGIEAVVYGIVRDHHGSVSAEHGIGTHKLPWLPFSRTEAELSLLRTLKAAMDPKGILNPGKVLAL
jgi:FAD/FMN-containing dehydrogenase